MNRHSLDVPAELRWDDVVAKELRENLPYFLPQGRLVAIDGRTIEVEAAATVPAAQAAAAVAALLRKVAANLRDSRETVLLEQARDRGAHPDPMPALLASGALVQTGVAQFVYGGTLLSLLEGIDRLLLRHALELDATPQCYPVTVRAATLIESGYLRSFGQHAFFVAPIARSAQALERLGAVTDGGALEAANDGTLFAAHDQVLAPTVCYHCMEALRDRELPRAQRFTAVNPCHRSEVLAAAALDRLQCFRMREIVAFGDEVFVSRSLDASLEWSTRLLGRWNIAFRLVTATDPFFAGAAGGKQYFQAAFALKRELRLRTDFDDRWLSVASFNHHQQSLTRTFRIRAGDATHSGCTGWGYERFAYALLAQLGTDIGSWPVVVRDDLGL
jgi:seryl-tRNA synthetase